MPNPLDQLCIDTVRFFSVDAAFGASVPGDVVLPEYKFTVEEVCQRALALHAQNRQAARAGRHQ